MNKLFKSSNIRKFCSFVRLDKSEGILLNSKLEEFANKIENRRKEIENKNYVLAVYNKIMKKFPLHNYNISKFEIENPKLEIKTIDEVLNNLNYGINKNHYKEIINNHLINLEQKENADLIKEYKKIINEFDKLSKFNYSDVILDKFINTLSRKELAIDEIMNLLDYLQRVTINYSINFDSLKKLLETYLDKIISSFGPISIETANAYSLIGYVNLRLYKFDESEDYVLKSLEIFNKILKDDDIKFAGVYNILAQLGEIRKQSIDDIYNLYLNSYKLLTSNDLEEKDLVVKIESGYKLGLYYYKIKEFNKTIEIYENISQINTTNKHGINTLQNVNYILGEIYSINGYYKLSYNYYKKFIENEKNITSKMRIDSFNRICEYFKFSDDYTLKEDKKIYELLKFSIHVLKFLLHEKNSHIEFFLNHFKTLFESNQLAQNDDKMKKDLFELEIKLNVKLFKFEEALKVLENHKPVFPNKEVLNYFYKGSIYVYLNNYDKVIENFENVLKILKLKKISMTDLSRNLSLILSQCYSIKGENKKALEYLKEVKSNNPEDEVLNYTNSLMKIIISQKE